MLLQTFWSSTLLFLVSFVPFHTWAVLNYINIVVLVCGRCISMIFSHVGSATIVCPATLEVYIMQQKVTIILQHIIIPLHVDSGVGRDVEGYHTQESNLLIIFMQLHSWVFDFKYMHRLGYRQGIRYRGELQYSRNSRCCTGYRGTPPTCNRKCIYQPCNMQLVVHNILISL